MARKLGFKPRLRDTMLANAAYLAAMSPSGELPAPLAAALERSLPAEPKPRKRYGIGNSPATESGEGLDMDRIHRKVPLESDVVTAISQLLATHPAILIAIRMNSGAASYEAPSGRYAPVWFHRFLRYPEKMRMPDFIGWLKDGRAWAIEAKRPGWTRPRDDREREQAIYLEAIRNMGGTAGFCRGIEEARIIIES